MPRANQIADRFREPILDGKWIANTNIKELVSDLDWKQATTKIDSLNTIALLVFHIDYYIGGIVQVFEGGELEIRDKYSFDMPAVESQQDWESLCERLWRNTEKFASYVEQMSDEKLDEGFVKPKYGSYERNIESMIEHAYYHFGQISLIKKLVLAHV